MVSSLEAMSVEPTAAMALSHGQNAIALLLGSAFFVLVLVVWTLIWKGIALWRAARNGHKGWYIALLVINTAGILEIIYILAFSKPPMPPTPAEPPKMS